MATDLDTVTAIARALSNELNEAQEELEAATVRAVRAENERDAARQDVATLLTMVPQCDAWSCPPCPRPATRQWKNDQFDVQRCDEHAYSTEYYDDVPHAAVVRRHAGGQ